MSFSTLSDHAASSEAAFRFLDLPKELRLMVYERIPIKTSHRSVTPLRRLDYILFSSQAPQSRQNTLVIKSISTSILSTCRQIHDEAASIIHRKLLVEPVRMIAHWSCAGQYVNALLLLTLNYEVALLTKPAGLPFRDFFTQRTGLDFDYFYDITGTYDILGSPEDLGPITSFTEKAFRQISYQSSTAGQTSLRIAIISDAAYPFVPTPEHEWQHKRFVEGLKYVFDEAKRGRQEELHALRHLCESEEELLQELARRQDGQKKLHVVPGAVRHLCEEELLQELTRQEVCKDSDTVGRSEWEDDWMPSSSLLI